MERSAKRSTRKSWRQIDWMPVQPHQSSDRHACPACGAARRTLGHARSLGQSTGGHGLRTRPSRQHAGGEPSPSPRHDRCPWHPFRGGLCVAYDFKEQLLACELVASSPRVCLGACVFSTMWMRKSVETVMCRCASISTTIFATRAQLRRALSRRE